MNKRRNSKRSLALATFSLLIELGLGLITLIAITQWQISTLLLIGVILAVIVAIIQVLIWFHTAFYLVNQTFYYETGVIIKKVHKIPLDNILGVDVQSNLRQRLFGLKYVKIDRGAKGEIEDLQLTLTTKEAQNLKNELLHTSKQAQVAVDNPLFHLNTQ
ncbi:MAG: PH domain-containing protein, partial [Culicoidibacterales bacterium]